jgi:sec-independent protein translocase protein TatA
MPRLFEGPGIWIILVVVILLFGATRLPALARSIGQSTKILKDELKPDGSKATEPVAPTAAAAQTVAEPAAPLATPAEAAPTKSAKSDKSGKSAKS